MTLCNLKKTKTTKYNQKPHPVFCFWICSLSFLVSSPHGCRHMLFFAVVTQLRLKLTHLLLFNFNLYQTLFCQNIMFWAATALLLRVIGVLGIILNTTCLFLIADPKVETWDFAVALHSREQMSSAEGHSSARVALYRHGFSWYFCSYLISAQGQVVSWNCEACVFAHLVVESNFYSDNSRLRKASSVMASSQSSFFLKV